MLKIPFFVSAVFVFNFRIQNCLTGMFDIDKRESFYRLAILQAVEKRYERSQYKAPNLNRGDEKAAFIRINEHFEENFNAVVASAIVFKQPDNPCSVI
jgi:hypothetical protein